MNSKRSAPAAVVGGSSLLVIFTVLCLTVFALLGLSTAQTHARLSDASAQAVLDFYAADTKAQEVFALLRNGQSPPDVPVQGAHMDSPQGPQTLWFYSVPIDDTQELQVELLQEGNRWTATRWQAVSTADWTPDPHLPVWDGQLN